MVVKRVLVVLLVVSFIAAEIPSQARAAEPNGAAGVEAFINSLLRDAEVQRLLQAVANGIPPATKEQLEQFAQLEPHLGFTWEFELYAGNGNRFRWSRKAIKRAVGLQEQARHEGCCDADGSLSRCDGLQNRKGCSNRGDAETHTIHSQSVKYWTRQ